MSRRPVVLVHGGAGRHRSAEREAVFAGCRAAAEAGWAELVAGRGALDAVQAAVTVLEDNPLFNAGTGAVLNEDGEVELDASLMDGARLAAGACAAVRHVKNPIALARAVLEEGRHVLLCAAGAERFAREHGIATCAPQTLVTPLQRERFLDRGNTVGAVACDAGGRLAAATSTGGVFRKRAGRIGDSALIGCGTYANRHAAVSCTGLGEALIRTVLAKGVADRVMHKTSVTRAARQAVTELARATSAHGGLIVLDRRGRAAWARNAGRMPVALISDAGVVLDW